MKLLRYADYKFSFDFNFTQRQKHMYMCVFIKRTSRQLFIMHWLSRSGLQFAHTLNQCSHHGFPALGQMVLALGFIEVVTCYPLRFRQGESTTSLCCLRPQIKSMIVPNILILTAHPYCSVDRRSLIVLQHGKTKEGFYRESQNQSLRWSRFLFTIIHETF